MKRFLLSALVAGLGLAGTATAQNEADVYILHGINGIDLQASEDFLVDIQLNDAPLLAAVPFRARTDAYELAAGTYNVKISPADLNNPFSQPPVLDLDVTFDANKTYTVMAHLKEDFSPTASLFTMDLSEGERTESRVGIHHTAAAPAVDVSLESQFNFISPIFVPGATNGAQVEANLFFGFWDLALNAAGTMTTVFNPPARFVGVRQYYGVFFVGSLANSTFEGLIYKY